MSDTPSPPLPGVVQGPGIRYLVPIRDVERELSNQMNALQGAGSAPVQRGLQLDQVGPHLHCFVGPGQEIRHQQAGLF